MSDDEDILSKLASRPKQPAKPTAAWSAADAGKNKRAPAPADDEPTDFFAQFAIDDDDDDAPVPPPAAKSAPSSGSGLPPRPPAAGARKVVPEDSDDDDLQLMLPAQQEPANAAASEPAAGAEPPEQQAGVLGAIELPMEEAQPAPAEEVDAHMDDAPSALVDQQGSADAQQQQPQTLLQPHGPISTHGLLNQATVVPPTIQLDAPGAAVLIGSPQPTNTTSRTLTDKPRMSSGSNAVTSPCPPSGSKITAATPSAAPRIDAVLRQLNISPLGGPAAADIELADIEPSQAGGVPQDAAGSVGASQADAIVVPPPSSPQLAPLTAPTSAATTASTAVGGQTVLPTLPHQASEPAELSRKRAASEAASAGVPAKRGPLAKQVGVLIHKTRPAVPGTSAAAPAASPAINAGTATSAATAPATAVTALPTKPAPVPVSTTTTTPAVSKPAAIVAAIPKKTVKLAALSSTAKTAPDAPPAPVPPASPVVALPPPPQPARAAADVASQDTNTAPPVVATAHISAAAPPVVATAHISAGSTHPTPATAAALVPAPNLGPAPPVLIAAAGSTEHTVPAAPTSPAVTPASAPSPRAATTPAATAVDASPAAAPGSSVLAGHQVVGTPDHAPPGLTSASADKTAEPAAAPAAAPWQAVAAGRVFPAQQLDDAGCAHKLERMLLEAQGMLVEVLDVRAQTAFLRNKLVRLDNPMLRSRILQVAALKAAIG